MEDQAKDVIGLWDRLDGERSTWRVHWQECADYMQPERRDYTNSPTPGAKRMQNVFDGTPLWALEQFAAGIHARLCSPTLRWFNLQPDDDALAQDSEVMAWFDDTTERMYNIFAGAKHNFASQSYEMFKDIGLIGTGVMAALESSRSGILFSTRHLKECVIQENEADRVDTLVRRWQYTAKQAFQAWGVKAGPKVLDALEKEPGKKFNFLHSVRPRLKRDNSRPDARNLEFESLFVGADDGVVIHESGFHEFPYLVPRFSKAAGEIYGRGPGMAALPDVKMLNEMAKTVLKAAQKVVDPPLQVPDDGFLLAIKTVPGALNYYRPGSRDRVEPIQTHGDVRLGLDLMNYYAQRIIRTFYVDLMSAPGDQTDPRSSAGKGVTATYVNNQRDLNMLLLSPMLARQQSEFSGPLIDRVFGIMWRQSMALKFGPGSMLAQPPAKLSGVGVHVEYVSPIAVAQRATQLDSVARLVQTQLLLKQVDPNSPLVIDVEAIMRLTGKDLNTPAVALKSPDQMQAEAQAAQQAQAEMNAHAQAGAMADTLQKGTKAIQNLAQAQQAAGQTGDIAGQGLNDNGAQAA